MIRRLTGEAVEQQILERLRGKRCLVSETNLIPLARPGGWMHSFQVRWPGWLWGHGKQYHLTMTTVPGGGYSIGYMRTDGKGSYKSWRCGDLNSMLASI